MLSPSWLLGAVAMAVVTLTDAWVGVCTGDAPFPFSVGLGAHNCSDCCAAAITITSGGEPVPGKILGVYAPPHWGWCSNGELLARLHTLAAGEPVPTEGCPEVVMAQRDAWPIGFAPFFDDLNPTIGGGLNQLIEWRVMFNGDQQFAVDVVDAAGFGFGNLNSFAVGLTVDEVPNESQTSVYSFEVYVLFETNNPSGRSFAIFHYGDLGTDDTLSCPDDPTCRGVIWKEGAPVFGLTGSCPQGLTGVCKHFLMSQSNVGTPGLWIFEISHADAINTTSVPSLAAWECPPADFACDGVYPCSLGSQCDETTHDPMTECRTYGRCFPIGFQIVDEGCTRGCVCAQKKTSKPAKWSCGGLKSGKGLEPACQSCATGECTDLMYFEPCMLPCFCGVDKKTCGGEANTPCRGADIPVTAKNTKTIFKGKDLAKKLCNACADATCACNTVGAASTTQPPPGLLPVAIGEPITLLTIDTNDYL